MDNISLVCLVEDFTTLASSPSALCAHKAAPFPVPLREGNP